MIIAVSFDFVIIGPPEKPRRRDHLEYVRSYGLQYEELSK
jgi:hypothetical protein